MLHVCADYGMGPSGSKNLRPLTRGWGVQARNIVRRERIECTCSPMDREFDISDTRGCGGEGVCTYRLVVQVLPIVLGPTCGPSTLHVQKQISTTRVSSRRVQTYTNIVCIRHGFSFALLVVRSSDGQIYSEGEKYEQSFYFGYSLLCLRVE